MIQAGPKHSVPKGLLVKLGGTDKTFLSLSGARGHILPERLLASTTTCHDSAYLCVHRGGTMIWEKPVRTVEHHDHLLHS